MSVTKLNLTGVTPVIRVLDADNEPIESILLFNRCFRWIDIIGLGDLLISVVERSTETVNEFRNDLLNVHIQSFLRTQDIQYILRPEGWNYTARVQASPYRVVITIAVPHNDTHVKLQLEYDDPTAVQKVKDAEAIKKNLVMPQEEEYHNPDTVEAANYALREAGIINVRTAKEWSDAANSSVYPPVEPSSVDTEAIKETLASSHRAFADKDLTP